MPTTVRGWDTHGGLTQSLLAIAATERVEDGILQRVVLVGGKSSLPGFVIACARAAFASGADGCRSCRRLWLRAWHGF
jgi:hypothetical protein